MKQNLLALISGVIFGLGLCISRMADPNKVLNFLDVTGNWDPSLMLVMGGALAVTLITFRFILKQAHPVLTEKFQLPTKKDLDTRLILGATLFGIGWGMIGFCPGPAITAIGFGLTSPYIVVVMMLIGFLTHKLLLDKG
ncbi:MAG TPA: YeeE/YedE family protein [Thiotrichaceae bacterium]|jgi:uncharacterized membrane protein YedE/YeeE|nr:YeeE/YedE family protein [Thiotrichaceae bacterium]HIM08056.1 YeeE/YedE family protein [Gammaproteobacteria bacterium]